MSISEYTVEKTTIPMMFDSQPTPGDYLDATVGWMMASKRCPDDWKGNPTPFRPGYCADDFRWAGFHSWSGVGRSADGHFYFEGNKYNVKRNVAYEWNSGHHTISTRIERRSGAWDYTYYNFWNNENGDTEANELWSSDVVKNGTPLGMGRHPWLNNVVPAIGITRSAHQDGSLKVVDATCS